VPKIYTNFAIIFKLVLFIFLALLAVLVPLYATQKTDRKEKRNFSFFLF